MRVPKVKFSPSERSWSRQTFGLVDKTLVKTSASQGVAGGGLGSLSIQLLTLEAVMDGDLALDLDSPTLAVVAICRENQRRQAFAHAFFVYVSLK